MVPYSEPWQSQNSLFKHLQQYLDIFRDTDAYSATPTDAQLEITHYSFCETLHLICPVTFCYIHIRHVQNSDIIGTVFYFIFLGICRYIQSYSALLRHIHAYWDIIKVWYSDIISTLSDVCICRNLAYS